MSDNDKFREIMELVAIELMGEPNEKLSHRPRELRWGKNGSFSVDLTAGTWYNHEDQSGGGVIQLVMAFEACGENDAVTWLIEKGFLEDRRSEGNDPPAAYEVPGGFPDWMEPKPVASFEYYDDKDQLAYQVLKFPKTSEIRYKQRRPYAGNTWIWALQAGEYGKSKKGKDYFRTREGKAYDDVIHVEDTVRWLYRRKEVIRQKKKGGFVGLMEGEKDVETMRSWGFVATTNAGGAKYWQDSFDDDLAECDVVIFVDNDDTGRDRALLRAASLKGKAKRVRVLDISLHWKDCPPKGDISDWKEKAFGTKERLEELLKHAVEPEKPKSKFNAIHWRDISLLEVRDDYLIHKLLTLGDTSILAGASMAGKSFMGIHMGLCVARGLPWFGHRVVKGGVAYQAGEGGRGVQKRLIAYRQAFEVPSEEEVPFVLLPSRVNLFARDGNCDMFIEELRMQMLQLSEPLRLVVIDTLSKASAGAQENDGKDMSIIMNNVERIRQATGAHVMVVHHLNSGGEKIRGHTSLKADVDQLLLITNDPDTQIKTLKVDKLKDDDPGEEIRFMLTRTVIGTDPGSGDEISSCVVMTVSEKEKFTKEKEAEGFSPTAKERAFLLDFFEARRRHGNVVDESDPRFPHEASGKQIVDWNDFVAVVQEKQLGHDDDSEQGKKRSRDVIRKQFEAVRSALDKGKVMGFKKPYMWWTGKPIKGFYNTFPRKAKDTVDQSQTGMFDGYADPEMQEDIKSFLDSEKDIPF